MCEIRHTDKLRLDHSRTTLRIVEKLQFRAAYPQAGRRPARLIDAGLVRSMLHQDALQSMF